MNPGVIRQSIHRRLPPSLAAGRALVLLSLLVWAGVEARGQSPSPPQREDGAPPPLKYIPEAARAKLDDARDMKARTRLSLELAEERLASAAAHAGADRFVAATGELGIYEAIVQDAINFLKKPGRVTNKQRDLFKRIEVTLRSHVPRIETIRRGMPAQEAAHVQVTLDFVRDARAAALNSFYDDSIIPDAPAPKENPAGGDRAKGVAPAAEKKPDQR